MGSPTHESVIADATRLGRSYTRVGDRTSDLIAEARGLLRARGDVPELVGRGYHVTDEMFATIQLAADLLVPLVARKVRAISERRAETEKAFEARSELSALRQRVADIGAAAGLPATLFSVGEARRSSLQEYLIVLQAVLINARTHRDLMPDRAVLDGLIKRGEALIEANHQARAMSSAILADKKRHSATIGQLKRLLLDAMRHVSKQGLAAFPDDPQRQSIYRLQIIAARKAGSGKTTTRPAEARK